MLNARIHKQYGMVIGFCIEGHADFDIYGKDIVCAAASAAADITCIGLMETLGLTVDYLNDGETFYCYLIDADIDDKRALTLLDAFGKYMNKLSEAYPKNIKIQIYRRQF